MDIEDLRLAYVSVTRAIEKLDMSEWAHIAPRDFLKETYSENDDNDAELEEVLEEISESPRKGKRWSYQEDLDLVGQCIAGKSFAEISTSTGRTISGLESRMGKWFLHASLVSEAGEFDPVSFSGDGWDDDKRERLLTIWEQDISIQEIAEELEVSEFRVATQVIKNDLVIFDQEFVTAVKEFYAGS
jgi:hypothetical protein